MSRKLQCLPSDTTRQDLLTMYAIMGMVSGVTTPVLDRPDRRFPKELPDHVHKAEGLKKYEFDGISVWALNEKNATRKIIRIKTDEEKLQ